MWAAGGTPISRAPASDHDAPSRRHVLVAGAGDGLGRKKKTLGQLALGGALTAAFAAAFNLNNEVA
jgi:hypothetical protein